MIIFLYQFSPSITLGNQKWKGAAPLFSNREEEIKEGIKLLKLILKFKNIKNIKIANKRILEAIACTKKYFKEDSEENKLFELIIKGIKDNKLISNPIQTLNQELAEIVIKVPKIIEKINKNL